jgi:hypothetical protein
MVLVYDCIKIFGICVRKMDGIWGKIMCFFQGDGERELWSIIHSYIRIQYKKDFGDEKHTTDSINYCTLVVVVW